MASKAPIEKRHGKQPNRGASEREEARQEASNANKPGELTDLIFRIRIPQLIQLMLIYLLNGS